MKIHIDEAKKRLSEDGRGIRIVSGYTKMTAKAEFECLAGHRWVAMAYSVIGDGTGCPKCCNENHSDIMKAAYARPNAKKKLTDAMIARYARPEERARTGARIKALWSDPEYKSKMKVKMRESKKRGWNNPKKYRRLGYEVIWLYIIEFLFNGEMIQKVGITSNRRRRFRDFGDGIQIIFCESGSPEYICKREKEILKASRPYHANLPKSFKGHSECFTRVIDPRNLI